MAKKFVPRQRKHKVLARQAAAANNAVGGEDAPAQDSNVLEIIPQTSEKALAAKKLRDELKDQGVKVSGKKAKRLEKYIENKLKKDENRVLLAKLANNKVDTTLFSSTRNLGQRKETKRQSLQRALREHKAGLGHGDELLEERGSSDSEPEQPAEIERPQAIPEKDLAPVFPSVTGGSGLKRPLELDDDGRPVIPKRQKRGGVKMKVFPPSLVLPVPEPETTSEDDWNGFSSDNHSADEKSASGDESESRSKQEEFADEAESDAGSEEDEDPSDTDNDYESDDNQNDVKERSSAFKAWAHQQRNEALGYAPVDSKPAILDIPNPKDFKPRPVEQEPLPIELQPTSDTGRKAFNVLVTRPAEVQEERLKLPVVAEEQVIMEAIHNNEVGDAFCFP